MKFLDSAPPPVSDKVTDQGGMLTAVWREWFMRMPDTLSAIPSRINVVELSGQTSSLAATDFSGGALKAGIYRATYYARLTAGSLAVTFSWTDGGSAVGDEQVPDGDGDVPMRCRYCSDVCDGLHWHGVVLA